jgi:uncharacterized protein YegJ (DUF2314 family)
MKASFAAGDDAELHQAYARARETVRFFFRELSWEGRRIVPGLDLAAIKAPFADGEVPPDDPSIEHMWMNDVWFDGRDVHGTLLNKPFGLTSVTAGDRVAVPLTKISDWMYAVRGVVCGGFTIDTLRARMSDAERKQHDRAWGLEFGAPGEIDLVPRDWYMPKRGIMDKLFGREQGALPDPATLEHPMAVNMEPSVRTQLAQNPSFVHAASEDGFTFLHQQAIAGDTRSVRAALEVGANRAARTSLGFMPVDFARILGWPEVVALLDAQAN